MDTNIEKKIEIEKQKLIDNAIAQYKKTNRGLSKALNYLKPQIENMFADGLSMSEIAKLLSSVLDVNISYDTFRMWVSRHLKNQKKRSKKNVEKEKSERTQPPATSVAPKRRTPLRKKLEPNDSKKNEKTFEFDPLVDPKDLF